MELDGIYMQVRILIVHIGVLTLYMEVDGIHTGEKPYSAKDGIHTGEKPYSAKDGIHTGEKPYSAQDGIHTGENLYSKHTELSHTDVKNSIESVQEESECSQHTTPR